MPIKTFIYKPYRFINKFIIKTLGTGFYERKWTSRNLEAIKAGFSNLSHPHRPWLIENLKKIGHFNSLIEIGCGYGPNLIHIAKSFPQTESVGIDINPNSINQGILMMKNLGIDNTTLISKRGNDLSDFDDKSFDVCLTDAFLLYIGPDKILPLIKEIKRITRKTMLFIEMHNINTPAIGDLTPDGWVRNYHTLFEPFKNELNLEIIKIPQDLWPDGRWPEYGYLIKATFKID